jgi:hypothetical protein
MGKKLLLLKAEFFQHLFTPAEPDEWIMLRFGGPDLPPTARLVEFSVMPQSGIVRAVYDEPGASPLVLVGTGSKLPLIDGTKHLEMVRARLALPLEQWIEGAQQVKAEIESLRAQLAGKCAALNLLRAKVATMASRDEANQLAWSVLLDEESAVSQDGERPS